MKVNEESFEPRPAETETVYPEAATSEPVEDPPGRPPYKEETERIGEQELPNTEPDRTMPRVSAGPTGDAPDAGGSADLPGEKRGKGDARGHG